MRCPPLTRCGPLVRPWLGADESALPVTTSAEAPAYDARRASSVGQGLFVGAAYGIALGMVLSELVLRKRDAATQLKQNHSLIALSALLGGAAGALSAVQAAPA